MALIGECPLCGSDIKFNYTHSGHRKSPAHTKPPTNPPSAIYERANPSQSDRSLETLSSQSAYKKFNAHILSEKRDQKPQAGKRKETRIDMSNTSPERKTQRLYEDIDAYLDVVSYPLTKTALNIFHQPLSKTKALTLEEAQRALLSLRNLDESVKVKIRKATTVNAVEKAIAHSSYEASMRLDRIKKEKVNNITTWVDAVHATAARARKATQQYYTRETLTAMLTRLSGEDAKFEYEIPTLLNHGGLNSAIKYAELEDTHSYRAKNVHKIVTPDAAYVLFPSGKVVHHACLQTSIQNAAKEAKIKKHELIPSVRPPKAGASSLSVGGNPRWSTAGHLVRVPIILIYSPAASIANLGRWIWGKAKQCFQWTRPDTGGRQPTPHERNIELQYQEAQQQSRAGAPQIGEEFPGLAPAIYTEPRTERSLTDTPGYGSAVALYTEPRTERSLTDTPGYGSTARQTTYGFTQGSMQENPAYLPWTDIAQQHEVIFIQPQALENLQEKAKISIKPIVEPRIQTSSIPVITDNSTETGRVMSDKEQTTSPFELVSHQHYAQLHGAGRAKTDLLLISSQDYANLVRTVGKTDPSYSMPLPIGVADGVYDYAKLLGEDEEQFESIGTVALDVGETHI